MPYASAPDPYCYPDTTVLKNIAELRTELELGAFEQESVSLRLDEPFPRGRFSLTHYCAFHRNLFQDVYAWAGRYRTIRISKGNSMFCYPENIHAQMTEAFTNLRRQNFLRGLDRPAFSVKLATFLATLNAIHPFREGNGRTQIVFAAALAAQAEHPIDIEALNPEEFLNAMIASFQGDEKPLADILLNLIDG